MPFLDLQAALANISCSQFERSDIKIRHCYENVIVSAWWRYVYGMV